MVNHVGIISSRGTIRSAFLVEALWRVRCHPLWSQYFGSETKVCIVRAKNIGPVVRKNIALHALNYRGLKYGWAKIILHFLDRLLTNGSYLFRRLAFLPNRPICSQLVSQVYSDFGLDFGVSPYEAQPDDIWDFVMNSDKYEVIRWLEPLRIEDL